jgi:hypothetical protein
VARDLAEQLPAPKSLFQWSRAAMLAVFPAEGEEERLRSRIGEALKGFSPERRVLVAGRTAIVLCPHRWLVLAGEDLESLQKTVSRIEEFAAS